MRQDVKESSPDRLRDVAPTTLVALTRAALAGPPRPVLYERDAGGTWQALSSSELLTRVESLAVALRMVGLARGDRVALMSPNRVDWIIANLGILFAGCVTVPIYATQALDQVAYIVADSGARAMFADTPQAAQRLRDAGVPLDPILFDGPPGDARALTAFVASGGRRARERPELPASYAAEIDPADLAILIYTSGTTGTPKGVMLSHNNIASNARDAFSLIRETVAPGATVLSILPFTHIYENTNIFGYLVRGSVIYVNRRIEGLLDDLRAVRPAVVFAVPRIFERTLAGIRAKVRADGGLRARLVLWALDVGLRYQRVRHAGTAMPALLALQYALAHALVLGKIRGQLGLDRLQFFVSGSASLQLDVALTFVALDVKIMEGYGLTEASPVITVNRVDAIRIGTVGQAIPNVEITLADDGEVLARGPNVMLGYYHKPGETAEMLRDGWLATGDIGTIDPDGYLTIVDRKKEIFKTSGGKYVSPTRVERAIARSPYVAPGRRVRERQAASGGAHRAELAGRARRLAPARRAARAARPTRGRARLSESRSDARDGGPGLVRASAVGRRPAARAQHRVRRADADTQSPPARRRRALRAAHSRVRSRSDLGPGGAPDGGREGRLRRCLPTTGSMPYRG